jgi:hypothetical protein
MTEPEVWERPFPHVLYLVADRTVVRYSGRYRELFPDPMVFAGTCHCGRCFDMKAGTWRGDRLTLKEYIWGPVELSHVNPDHVGAVEQSRYAHLLEGGPGA